MRRMYDDKGVKLAANTPIEVPAGTNPDDLIEVGTYKVKNVDINGTNYDGTIVVVPWDSHYFRQVFYTLDNKDPNPIFTRVRVNQTHPWKAWEIIAITAAEPFYISANKEWPTANNKVVITWAELKALNPEKPKFFDLIEKFYTVPLLPQSVRFTLEGASTSIAITLTTEYDLAYANVSCDKLVTDYENNIYLLHIYGDDTSNGGIVLYSPGINLNA